MHKADKPVRDGGTVTHETAWLRVGALVVFMVVFSLASMRGTAEDAKPAPVSESSRIAALEDSLVALKAQLGIDRAGYHEEHHITQAKIDSLARSLIGVREIIVKNEGKIMALQRLEARP